MGGRKGSLILTKVAISEANVIERDRERKRERENEISRFAFLVDFPLLLFLLLPPPFFFFSFTKSAISSASREILFPFSPFLSFASPFFCFSSSSSLSIYFSLFEAVVRVTSNVNQSVGIVASFATPAVLRSRLLHHVSFCIGSSRRYETSFRLIFLFFFFEREEISIVARL